jgi:hypothetical protein
MRRWAKRPGAPRFAVFETWDSTCSPCWDLKLRTRDYSPNRFHRRLHPRLEGRVARPITSFAKTGALRQPIELSSSDERANSPGGGERHREKKDQAHQPARWCVCAPSLEHGDQSNDKQDKRNRCETFQPHNFYLRERLQRPTAPGAAGSTWITARSDLSFALGVARCPVQAPLGRGFSLGTL